MFPSFVAQPSHTMADHPSSPRWRSPTWNWIRRQRRGGLGRMRKFVEMLGRTSIGFYFYNDIYWIPFSISYLLCVST